MLQILTTKYRNTLQILTTQPNTETHCKNSQLNQIQKHTAITHNSTDIETHCKYSQLNQIQKHAANTHNTTKYRNTHCKYSQLNQIQKHAANTHNQIQKHTVKNSQLNQIQKHTANTHNSTNYRNMLQILTTNTKATCLNFRLPQLMCELMTVYVNKRLNSVYSSYKVICLLRKFELNCSIHMD